MRNRRSGAVPEPEDDDTRGKPWSCALRPRAALAALSSSVESVMAFGNECNPGDAVAGGGIGRMRAAAAAFAVPPIGVVREASCRCRRGAGCRGSRRYRLGPRVPLQRRARHRLDEVRDERTFVADARFSSCDFRSTWIWLHGCGWRPGRFTSDAPLDAKAPDDVAQCTTRPQRRREHPTEKMPRSPRPPHLPVLARVLATAVAASVGTLAYPPLALAAAAAASSRTAAIVTRDVLVALFALAASYAWLKCAAVHAHVAALLARSDHSHVCSLPGRVQRARTDPRTGVEPARTGHGGAGHFSDSTSAGRHRPVHRHAGERAGATESRAAQARRWRFPPGRPRRVAADHRRPSGSTPRSAVLLHRGDFLHISLLARTVADRHPRADPVVCGRRAGGCGGSALAHLAVAVSHRWRGRPAKDRRRHAGVYRQRVRGVVRIRRLFPRVRLCAGHRRASRPADRVADVGVCGGGAAGARR
eukprot:ctg_2874.g401